MSALDYLLFTMLSYTSFSQSCTTENGVDIIFAIDGSEQVSSSDFTQLKDIVSSILSDYVPFPSSKSPNIGFVLLTEDDSVSVSTTATTYADAISQLSSLSQDTSFSSSARNIVEVTDAVATLFDSSSSTNERFLFILTTGNVCFTCSSPSMYVCKNAYKLKQASVTTITLGFGLYWTQDVTVSLAFKCLGEVYSISETTSSAFSSSDASSSISSLLCQSNCNLKFTEVNPTQFVELYNLGKDCLVSDLRITDSSSSSFTISSDSSLTLAQGSFLLLYSSSATLDCTDCLCSLDSGTNLCQDAIYIEISSFDTSASSTSFSYSITQISSSSTLDSIAYDSSTYPLVDSLYSYELDYIGYSNKLGDNFQSCSTSGSPGSPPTPSCTYQGTSDTSSSSCDFTRNNLCYPIQQIDFCIIYKIGTNSAILTADTSTISDRNFYIGYEYQSSVTKSITSPAVSNFGLILVSDFYFDSTEDCTLSWQPSIGLGIPTTCTSLYTMYPSTKPTFAPTKKPTPSPSKFPTTSPTPGPRYFFLDGSFCIPGTHVDSDEATSRCECYALDVSCCSDTSVDYCTDDFVELLTVTDNYPFTLREYKTSNDASNLGVYTCVNWQIKHEYMCRSVDDNNICNTPVYNFTQGFTFKSYSGSVCFDKSETEIKPLLNITEESLPENSTESLFYQFYSFTVTNCTDSSADLCSIIYPTNTLFFLKYGTDDPGIVVIEEEIAAWIWWLVIALVALLLCIALLLWQYCWKNKKQSNILKEQKEELIAIEDENELGFQHDLDPSNVNYNPMNPSLPQFGRKADADVAQMDLSGNKKIDDVATVRVDKFKEKQQFEAKMGSGYEPVNLPHK